MHFGLLTIGDELLNGKVLDRNKLHIGQLVDTLGGSLVIQLSTPDSLDAMEEAFLFAMERCDILFMTGGLGGTHDDLSCTLVERVFPGAQAEELANQVGTASGWLLKRDGKTLILLPGPPRENQPMLRLLREKLHSESIWEQWYSLIGLPEVEIERRLRMALGEEKTQYFATYVGEGFTTLRVRTSDQQIGSDIADEVEQLFVEEIYARGDETIPARLHSLLLAGGHTLALAESASCGGIASLLSQMSGASDVLYGSYVVYSPEAKHSMLGIDKTLLKDECVGEEITWAMAKAALEKSGCTVALALTGFAEHTDPNKHGLVHVAMCSDRFEKNVSFQLRGNREANLVRMSYRALAFAIDFLLKEEKR